MKMSRYRIGFIGAVLGGALLLSWAFSQAFAQSSSVTVVLPPSPPLGEVIADTPAGQLGQRLTQDMANSLPPKEDGVSCTVVLEPAQINDDLTAVSEVTAWACDDGRHSDGVSASEVADVVAASVWVGSYYAGSNRSGNELRVVTSHSAGCADNSRYIMPNMGDYGASNTTSSAEANTAAGCNKNQMWTLPNYAGATITANSYLARLADYQYDNLADSGQIYK